MSHNRAAVIGIGLIGGSVAARLRSDGNYVLGLDSDPSRAEIGLHRGLIDQVERDLPSLVAKADTVVLAVPVTAILELLPLIDRLAPPDALIIDVGSVKAEVVEIMALLEGGSRAVGGHPLAGSERSGPDAADEGLFQNRVFVLTPSEKTSEPTLRRARHLVASLGARTEVMSATKHDEILARTSHLPQLLASTLSASLHPEDISFAGAGLDDMTRLAGSDPVVWRDIFLSNRRQVLTALENYRTHLGEIERLIEREDVEGIQEWITLGRTRRSQLSDLPKGSRLPLGACGLTGKG